MSIKPPSGTLIRSVSEKAEKEFQSFELVVSKRDKPLPVEFDGRIVWKGLLSKIRNQGMCGSCYSVSAVTTLKDRYAIQSLGQLND